jgi:orotate phosphoribosyltransferase
MAVVRKERKEYGTQSQVEGQAPVGARIALIEDVSTTGHQTLAAAKALEEEGAIVELIILSIDRGGADSLREAGYGVEAIASLRPIE